MRALRLKRIAVAIILVALTLTIAPANRASAGACPCSLFGSATPGTPDGGPDSPTKLGVMFHADTDGYLTGIRFYKSAANTGTHIGELWAYNGSNQYRLASVTFTGETASGWQSALFSQAVKAQPGETYVVTYSSPTGHYSYDTGYFASPVDNAPLHGQAGLYSYTSSFGITNRAGNNTNTNYWVDPIFQYYQNETSLLNTTYAPPAVGNMANGDPSVEVGTRFTSDINTTVLGIRFWGNETYYKPDTVNLWKSDGTLLASATDFDYNTRSGWLELYFSAPVSITAGTEYVASYDDSGTTGAQYGYTHNYFTSPYTNGPFHAPVNAGVYVDTNSSAFPTTQTDTNYWVDPVFANEADVTVSASIDPAMTFSVANKATACNGEPNFVAGGGGASTVALGHLAPSTNASAGQALSVATNAGNGFTVYVRGAQSGQNLRSGSHGWSDVAGTYGSPAALGAGEQFGYTYKDSTASSTITNPGSALFAALGSTNQAIMGSSTSSSGSGCIGFTAQSGTATPAGLYSASVLYTAVSGF